MNGEPEPPVAPATIQRLANGIYASMAMKAGMALDLFTPLAEGPMDAEALAAAVGVAPARFELLLYALVSAGLLSEEGGRFANTPEAERYLVRGLPTYLGGAHGLYDELWGAAMLTEESLRAGAPRAKHDFANMDAAELESFYRGTHSGALNAGRTLAGLVDFSAARNLIDVGGGSGGVAMGLCEANPDLHATVADLPSVTPVTRAIVAEAGKADRISVLDADLVEMRPEGTFDAAVMRNLMQVLSADQNRRVLAHVGEAMTPGARVVIWGWMLDDDRHAPFESAIHNLVFINFYDHGQAYTEAQHRDWLSDAGFVDAERRVLAGGFSLIAARKA